MDTLGEEDSLVVSDLLFHAVEKADNATAFRLFATLFAHAIKDLGAKDHPSFQVILPSPLFTPLRPSLTNGVFYY